MRKHGTIGWNSDGSNLFSPQLITRKGPPFSTLLSSQLVENEKKKLFRERHLNYKLPSQRSTANSMISKMLLSSLVKTKSPLRFSSRSQHVPIDILGGDRTIKQCISIPLLAVHQTPQWTLVIVPFSVERLQQFRGSWL